MNTISIQDLVDLLEMAALACRTARDKRFVNDIAEKIQVAQQVAQMGKKPEGEEQKVAAP